MESRALIHQQLGVSQQIIKQCLSNISDEDARRMPNSTLSPIIWQLGHLAVANAGFLERAGLASSAAVPGTFPDLFKTGTGGMAEYPSLDTVVRVLDGTHEALIRGVAEVNLDGPNEGPRGLWKNFGEMFVFSNTHRWYHIGKINSLRALLGKPRLFG